MYYSYVMGISSSITQLRKKGFAIERDGENYTVAFPKENAQIWEGFVQANLAVEYWNEYLADDRVVFLFHLSDGFKRYEVHGFDNKEVLALCEKLCGCHFESIQSMLLGNWYYQKVYSKNVL